MKQLPAVPFWQVLRRTRTGVSRIFFIRFVNLILASIETGVNICTGDLVAYITTVNKDTSVDFILNTPLGDRFDQVTIKSLIKQIILSNTYISF